MKLDIKILVVFILTIVIYGGSYLLTEGKFAFPLQYVDLSIAAVSLFFLIKVPFSQYSVLMISFGFSFAYMLFGVYEVKGGSPTIFMMGRDISIFLFAVFLLVRVFRKKDLAYRGVFLFFGVLILGQLLFNSLNLKEVDPIFADLIKSALVFSLCLLIFSQHSHGKKIKQGVKLMFVLVAMYCVRNIVWILSASDLLS